MHRNYFPAKALFYYLLMAFPVSGVAANTWEYHQEIDRSSNTSYSFALSPIPSRGLYDNLRLEITCKDKALQVIINADSLIASQDSLFAIEYQIDKNSPVTLQMKTFKDSKRRGYNEEQAKPMIDGLLTGKTVFIRINTLIRTVLSAAMPLEKADQPIKQVMADCGLSLSNNTTVEPAYSLTKFEQEFSKLPAEQQQQVLTKIQKIILETQKALLSEK